MTEYVLYPNIEPFYRYAVLCRDEGIEVIPLVRLVPVRGEHHDEAVALLKRLALMLKPDAEKEQER